MADHALGSVADHRLALQASTQIGRVRSHGPWPVALGVAGRSSGGRLAPEGRSEGMAQVALAERPEGPEGVKVDCRRRADHMPAWVHTLVAAINVTLENVGKTVKLHTAIETKVDGQDRRRQGQDHDQSEGG